jgi:putative transposase
MAQAPEAPWSLDCSSDRLADGRRCRAFTFVDHRSRESPAIEVDRSRSGQRVVAGLERLASTHGLPKPRFVDPGPECTSKALDAWAPRHGVQLAFSRPGTPTANPFIEAVNARFREKCLHQPWCGALEAARTPVEAWRVEYKTERPHTALGHQVPAGDKARWLHAQETPTASDSPDRWTKLWVRTRP